LKILKSRSPSPADDGWNNAYKDFATACEDLEKALLHHFYSDLTKSTRQSLVELVRWVAGSFPLVSADTMKRLTKLCAQTQSYTTSCKDALRTGKEFFEGSWALQRNPNVDIEQKAQIVVDLWLQTCISELIARLAYIFRNHIPEGSRKESVESALLIRRLLFRANKTQAGGMRNVDAMEYAPLGSYDLNRFSEAIEQCNFEDFTKPSASENPEMMSCVELIERCWKNFPNATEYWLNFPETTLSNNNLQLKITPFMLCLLYWCKGHSLSYAMQTNTGWAMALVPDIAHIPLSTYQAPLSIENKSETPDECFLNLLKELNPLVNKCAVPLEEEAQNAFLEIKEKLQQLLQNPTQISCRQAVDFLNCLYYGASEQELAPDPTDEVPSSSEGKALPLSDVGLERFYALLNTIRKNSFEDDIKRMSLANLETHCNTILVEYHLTDVLPAVPVPPAVLPT
jgi:hypothetical protein